MDDKERPFKKARYIWQLKGKYHMKASSDQAEQCHRKAYRSSHGCSSNSSDIATVFQTISGQNNTDADCIDRVLINSELLDEEKLDDIPLTLVLPTMCHQEEFLREWQAKQMAKGCVDNTINELLEMWKHAGLEPDLLGFMDNDEHIEDEAILMAIQSHGLHRGIQPESNVNQETAANILHFSQVGFMPGRTETAHNNDSFLSAAITSAIKRKGLSSYAYS